MSVDMEQHIQDATKDKDVKEIDDVGFEALYGSHNDIPYSIVDTQQPIMCTPFYELAEVCKFKRINKRTNALKNWKWDEVIQIDSETEDQEEDAMLMIKRTKHACVVESNAGFMQVSGRFDEQKEVMHTVFLMIIWRIWMGRNGNVFKGSCSGVRNYGLHFLCFFFVFASLTTCYAGPCGCMFYRIK
ncbi:hypothetical protein Hanom_Chr09g00825711 [Helianthus anomalus]